MTSINLNQNVNIITVIIVPNGVSCTFDSVSHMFGVSVVEFVAHTYFTSNNNLMMPSQSACIAQWHGN